MLTFSAEDVLRQVRAAGEDQETVITFALPAPATRLILQQGKRITGAICNDVLEEGGPRVSRSWTAIAGTATLRVRADPGQETARADLLLEDVVLEGSDGDRITFDRFAWEDIPVGWYAG